MSTIYESRYASSPQAVKKYDTQELREEFLIENLMQTDKIVWVYTHYDRYMAGSVVPSSKALKLESIDPLKSENFLDRRELGAINIGGAGKITVDGTTYELNTKDALYIGKDAKEVTFESTDASNPAKFYMNSAPAHHSYQNKQINYTLVLQKRQMQELYIKCYFQELSKLVNYKWVLLN